MSKRIQQQSNSNPLATISAKQIAAWSAGIFGLVVACSCLGVLGQRIFRQEFLGERTRLIHLCKRNPSSNPAVCAEVLVSRTRNAHGTGRGQTIAGTLTKPTFNLSNDADADLRPPPDLEQ
jgi:hypothetical protein